MMIKYRTEALLWRQLQNMIKNISIEDLQKYLLCTLVLFNEKCNLAYHFHLCRQLPIFSLPKNNGAFACKDSKKKENNHIPHFSFSYNPWFLYNPQNTIQESRSLPTKLFLASDNLNLTFNLSKISIQQKTGSRGRVHIKYINVLSAAVTFTNSKFYCSV